MASLILYDGVCGLCDRFNRFVLRRDPRDRFRFGSLQGGLATDLLRRYGRDANRLDTVYVVVNYGEPGERLYAKAHAVLFVLETLGGVWRMARVFAFLPAAWLDGLYDFVATRRYRFFGRFDSCPVPDPGDLAKFIDDGTKNQDSPAANSVS